MLYNDGKEVNAMSTYTTGEIAKLCSVSVRTVQYYDKRGLLTPSELSEGGRRLYSENDLSKMKTICFLRDIDLSIEVIKKLLREENSGEVISLILDEQKAILEEEKAKKEAQLKRISEIEKIIGKTENLSVKSIGDAAHVMENKKKLRNLRLGLLITGIPVSALQVVSIILWITNGLWWLFVIWAAIAVPYGAIVSTVYFRKLEYICPECHNVFKPRFKDAFFANHTPTARKLTCTRCGKKSFCVEIYRKKNENE